MKRLFTLFVIVMSFSAITSLYAQVISLKGKIILKDKKGVVDPHGGEGVYVFMFNTAEDAKDFTSQYKNSPTGVIRAQHVSANESGEFTCSLLAGGHIVIYNPSTKKDPINREIKEADANTTIEFVFSDDGITLGNVDVTRDKVKVSGPKARKARGFGKMLTWTCDFDLIANQANHDSRLMVQPYAIDCQTEDTIQLMPPFAIEGKEYHNIQNRRMNYDYVKNDSVAPYLIDTLSLSKKDLVFRRSLVFEKPDINRSYHCTAMMWLEDYTHAYWMQEGEFGSCFVSNPFKLIAFHLTGGDMALDADEFFESPTSELRENNKSLHILFPVGQSVIPDTEDSNRQINSLINDLQSYGDRLAQVKIIGYASPDGSYAKNQKLAVDRANAVLQVIRQGINTRKVQLPPAQSVVCTWNDVADSLDARGYATEAQQMRDIINQNVDVFEKVKEMFIYDTVISEILVNQRQMYCSYMYSLRSQLSPDEAINNYRHDKAYQSGGTYRFSHGDWFNILSLSKDSLEQKQIIDRAYKEITTTESGYQYNAFAAYVANRKALDVIKAGGFDTTILKPFIDYAAGPNVTKSISFYNKAQYTVNRTAILANQAIMFLRVGNLPMSEFLVSKIPEGEQIKKEFGSYVDMMNWILRYDDETLTEKEKTKGRIGYDYVCEQDPKNNAILKAELWEDLGYERSYAIDLVTKNLPDDDARKWYLLAVLKSREVNIDDDATEGQPEFMKYIQKAIAMNPIYARYWASEANVQKYVFDHFPITAKGSSPKKTTAIVSTEPKLSKGNGIEKFKLEKRWEEPDMPFVSKSWVQGGIGIENVHTEAEVKYNPAFTVFVGVAKEFHKFHALRFDGQGAFSKCSTGQSYTQLGLRADYIFSVLQYLNGYVPNRAWDLSTVIGIGANWCKWGSAKRRLFPQFYTGVNYKYNLGANGAVAAEPYFVIKKNGAMLEDWRRIDVNFGVTFSYIFPFSK